MRSKSCSAICSSSGYTFKASESKRMNKSSYSFSRSKTFIENLKDFKRILPRKFNRCSARRIPTSELLYRMQNYLSDHKKGPVILPSPMKDDNFQLKKPKRNFHPKLTKVKLEGRENQSYNFIVVQESQESSRRMKRLLKRTHKDEDQDSTSKEIKSGQKKNFKILLEAVIKYKKMTGMMSVKIEEEIINMEMKREEEEYVN